MFTDQMVQSQWHRFLFCVQMIPSIILHESIGVVFHSSLEPFLIPTGANEDHTYLILDQTEHRPIM